jgi:cytochrome d ubiquinol oxidase subunit II
VIDDGYAGGRLDWLSPFSLLTGLAVVLGYALLGSAWLIWKTEGSVQAHARRLAFVLGIATLVAMATVSAATPLLRYAYWRRWFSTPNLVFTAQVPLLVIVCSVIFIWSLRRGAERLPFLMVLALFVLNFVGLGVSIFPYLVPPEVSIWDAAAPAPTQRFLLIGVAITLPLIIGYTTWAYWVFRGKVGTHGYH